MSASPQPPATTTPIRELLVVGLTLLVAVLAIAVWRQRVELHRLSLASAHDLERPAVTVRAANRRGLAVLPPRALAPMPDEVRAPEETNEQALLAARAAKPRASSASALAQLLGNAEFYQALGLHRQAALDARFAGLYRQLALSADELATFKRLLAEKENVALEVVAVSETQPDGPLPPEQLEASVGAARAVVENAIRASLGSERYAVYREYEQTLPQRALVAQLEQRLSYSPAPLTHAQAEVLVRIFVAHAPAAPVAPAAAVVVSADASTAVPVLQTDSPAARVSDAAIAESQTVLAPAQLVALRELQIEQQATARAMQQLRDALPASGERPRVPLQVILQ